MAKRPHNASTGSNATITFFHNSVPYPVDDVDSVEITDNSNLLTRRSLGTVITVSDIDYGNFTLDVKSAKTGSDFMRIAKENEKIHLQAIETPLWDILITIRSRDGIGLESITYKNCVLQFKNVSIPEAGQHITQSITITAESRKFNSLIPRKNFLP